MLSPAFVQNLSGLLRTQRSPVVMHSAEGQRKRAVVIGGSIGGLFAGLAASAERE
jgi:predicted alpha/beta superfamily hydrolase